MLRVGFSVYGWSWIYPMEKSPAGTNEYVKLANRRKGRAAKIVVGMRRWFCIGAQGLSLSARFATQRSQAFSNLYGAQGAESGRFAPRALRGERRGQAREALAGVQPGTATATEDR